jgi:hypothetical protein
MGVANRPVAGCLQADQRSERSGNKGAHMNIQAFDIRPLLLPGTLFLAVILSAACSPDPGKIGEGNVLRAPDSQDCQVLAAIATQHYRSNRTTNPPPPLKFEPGGTTWAPDCDWGRYDLAFARLDPAAKTRSEDVRSSRSSSQSMDQMARPSRPGLFEVRWTGEVVAASSKPLREIGAWCVVTRPGFPRRDLDRSPG